MELGQFKLDPRTKIIILVIISFMVFNEAPIYVSGILVLIPFICLFFSNYKKAAVIYVVLYVAAKYIQIFLLPNSTGIISIILVTFSYTSSRMLPILIMGYYTIASTKVSEFISAMEKSNVPNDSVKNVFKNGRMPTKEEYTKIWIDLINKIEREKATQ